MRVNIAAVKRTICTANHIYGKGEVMGAIFGMDTTYLIEDGIDCSNRGMVVRQLPHGMDAVEFRLLGNNTLKFLQKIRVII